MRLITSILTVLIVGTGAVQAQNYGWTAEDSLKGEAMIKTIEQSLDMFYAEYSPEGNYDSIIDALGYEPDQVPEFSDEVYCERLNVMNEMSPFHLDCNEATLSTIRFFVRKRRGFARVVLGRSKLYFDMFEEKLAKYGLPIELKYLAVIESGLRPQVKSRAGALGLWQFMYATGRMFGLKENSYIDQRMDPELATEAACQYLKKLYGIYNDWNLALAAYNAGPGNVNKAIRRSGNKLTYWEVRPFLPRETQGYVPNFIAAAYLLTYHAEHNIIPAEANIRYPQLDTMCLNKGVHMESMSEILGFELEEIQRLNPIYKKSFIPKSDPPQCVSLPLQLIGELVTLEDSLYRLEFARYNEPSGSNTSNQGSAPATNNNTNYTYHKVNSGETLGTIASRYGTSVAEIQRINGLRSTRIYVGQRLKVKAGATTNTNTNTTNSSNNSGNKKYYSVRSGDTFGRIAQRHSMTQSQLKRLNPGINISRLSIGQKIRIR
ncbi:MAG: transglycosylase SLT domain-containing protein [Crocinitomicaceae bacterium]|nr:transglycosylase SLT domain-containing protein [Crocinitomicaceae bacterium]